VTGEVLGHTEQTLGSGTIDTVQPKFSIGHFDPGANLPLVSDRVRCRLPGFRGSCGGGHGDTGSGPRRSRVAGAAGAAIPWRMKRSPLPWGIEGDGQKEIILASPTKFKCCAGRTIILARGPLEERFYRHWLGSTRRTSRRTPRRDFRHLFHGRHEASERGGAEAGKRQLRRWGNSPGLSARWSG